MMHLRHQADHHPLDPHDAQSRKLVTCSLWHQEELEQILNGIEFYNVLLSLLYQSTGVHLPSFKDYPNVKIISVFDSLGFLS